jgi:hypothetical protein
MNKIDAYPKTVRELLEKAKYRIDYYQREYKWKKENISALLEDLEGKFLLSYDEVHSRTKVQEYPHYFLGSIVISHKKNQNFIIDGQQRLTSLTLLLIYINHLQKGNQESDRVDVNNLIYSEKYGEKSFNIDEKERAPCMRALFDGEDFLSDGQPVSIRNIVARYNDISQLFPDTLKNSVLPYFTDWLIDNVDMVEITAYSDDDAYAIFETMNDRGLSLTPTEMLKGYLLSNIEDTDLKQEANDFWKSRLLRFLEMEEEEADFFKAWLRSQYADTIRERKKGAVNKDFERIGTGYHKWVRDERQRIGLNTSSDYFGFAHQLFDCYSTHYLRLCEAARDLTPGLEYVYYNGYNDFTLQDPLILSTIRPEDDLVTVDKKMRLVAGYIDILIARRIVNFRTLAYSSIVYTMFNLMKEIRGLDVHSLAQLLKRKVEEMEESFDGVEHLYMHQQNRYRIHFLLARITHHIEKECSIESDFVTYISSDIKKPFEIEHIWADKYEEHSEEFGHPEDFREYRNRIGGLILLPRGFNQSFGAYNYKQKLDAYFGQNMLAKTLHPNCYENNPSFLSYLRRSGLPFKPYPERFVKSDLNERQELYRLICEEIWSPDRFDREIA